MICGLPASLSNCTVHYLKDGVGQTYTTNATAAGCITVPNLTAATYDNIYVERVGCITNALGPVTLTNPANPVATASNNGPLCSGADLNLTGGPNTAPSPNDVTWNWTGPTGFNVLGVQNPYTHNSCTGRFPVLYTITVINQTTGCTDTETTVVKINKTPVLTGITYVNPTKCSTCNGSFTISGLDPNTSYTLHYLKNAFNQFPVNFTSSATGTYTRTNQCAATYDNIYVVSAAPASCISNALGPITLVDPPLPPQPGANSNSPVCAGDTLKLTSTSATYNASYRWSGPAAFGTNIAGQNQTIPNVTLSYTGTYSVTVKDTFNCTSLPHND